MRFTPMLGLFTAVVVITRAIRTAVEREAAALRERLEAWRDYEAAHPHNAIQLRARLVELGEVKE